MFALMHSTRLESLHLSVDPVTGLKAIIAIHNSRLGPALGGCRYLAYPNDETAVADAARLAQGMSYKAALAGLPVGGGTAVIIPRCTWKAVRRCLRRLAVVWKNSTAASSPRSTAAPRSPTWTASPRTPALSPAPPPAKAGS